MGNRYIIGCNNCITKEDLDSMRFDRTKIKGTFFDISTGGVMLCFCKEQLEKIYGIYKDYKREYRLLVAGDPPDEIYKMIKSVTHDEIIDKIIYENINAGYSFTEILGDLPYYCDACKKIYSNFYFQMEKDENIYTPKYNCKNCNNVLELVCPTWEKELGMGWAEDLEKISFKYYMYNENKKIKIKSNEKDIKLICDNCKNDLFTIMVEYWTD